MKIVLIGFMGSGKSTVGKYLSKLLKMSWIDMDHLVCQKTNSQNMDEVFAKGGEFLLRETEIAIAKEYAFTDDLIVSTGGGVVLNKIILDYFKKTKTKTVFLNAELEQIVKQLEGDLSRPLFKDLKEVKKNYAFRLPLYLNYADEIIDVNRMTPDKIALKIQEMINKDL